MFSTIKRSFNRPRITKQKSRSALGSEQTPKIEIPLHINPLPHGPEIVGKPNLETFVGRDVLIERLLLMLRTPKPRRGSYLIAGYRGVGKTSVVNRAITIHQSYGIYSRLNRYGSVHESRLALREGRSYLEKARIRNGGTKDSIFPWYLKPSSFIQWTLRAIPTLLYDKYIKLSHEVINRTKKNLYIPIRRIFRPVLNIHINVSHITSESASASFYTMIDRLCVGIERELQYRTKRFNIALIILTTSIATLIFTTGYFRSLEPLVSRLINYFAIAIEHLIPNSWVRIERFFESHREPLFYTVFFITSIAAYYLTRYFINFTLNRNLNKLTNLRTRSVDSVENVSRLSIVKSFLSRKTTSPPLDDSKIESKLLDILNSLDKGFNWRPDIIFIFDELDKLQLHDVNVNISPSEPNEHQNNNQTNSVQGVLGSLKTTITTGNARFIFIGGRDILDAYQAERGQISSLYESLFSQYFEVPSLLTDRVNNDTAGLATMVETYVCRHLLPFDAAVYLWVTYEINKSSYKTTDANQPYPDRQFDKIDELLHQITKSPASLYEPFRLRTYYHALIYTGIDPHEAQRTVHCLRNFVHYLTFHSGGNSKKLSSMFISFTRPSTIEPYNSLQQVLRFTEKQQRRLLASSNLHILLHHNLSRQLRQGGDKMAVTAFAAAQFLIKFHSYGFSRYHFERMSELLQARRPPELRGTLDLLLDRVFRPLIQQVNQGIYQYRFVSSFEQEIQAISRSNDLDAAAFNFSLAAMDDIKRHYQERLSMAYQIFGKLGIESAAKGSRNIAELNLAMGELVVIEGKLDEARDFYDAAVDALERSVREISADDSDIEIAQLLIESLLKLGHLEERRQRYDHAHAAYFKANQFAVNTERDDNSIREVSSGKHNAAILNHIWTSHWALIFLDLKKDPISGRNDLSDNQTDYFPENIPRHYVQSYQAGIAAIFFNDHKRGSRDLASCIRRSNITSFSREETTIYGARACISLSQNIAAGLCKFIQKTLESPHLEQMVYPDSLYADLLIHVMNNKSKNTSSYTLTEERIEELGTYKDGTAFFKSVNIQDILILSKFACNQFKKDALNFEAGVAAMSGISIWAMFYDLLTYCCSNPDTLRTCRFNFRRDFGQITAMAKAAEQCLHDSDDRAFVRFQETFRTRDISGFHHNEGFAEPSYDYLDEEYEESNTEEDGNIGSIPWVNPINGQPTITPGERLLDRTLTPSPHISSLRNALRLHACNARRGSSNASETRVPGIAWQLGSANQRLAMTAIWIDLLNGYFSGNDTTSIYNYDQSDLPLYSSRFYVFSQWIRGRHQLSRLRTQLFQESTSHRPDSESFFLKLGGTAVFNLYSSILGLRNLSGNDQAIMFPPPGLVFFHLWETLYLLVEYELRSDRFPKEDKRAACREASLYVRQKLIELLPQGVLASHLDLRYVANRAKRYLKISSKMGDVSSRGRRSFLRDKLYLKGDYNDSIFQLDWTLVQMVGPAAHHLIKYIDLQTESLKADGARSAEQSAYPFEIHGAPILSIWEVMQKIDTSM